MLYNSKNYINITFCGMMGSGKSTIGKKFAKIIDFNFIDTDLLIEQKVGKSISAIFKDEGELVFRNLENKIVSKILNKKKCVISLGGGALINKNIREVLKKNSLNIYLDVNKKKLIKRLKYSKNRPLLFDKDIEEQLDKLLNEREKLFKNADIIIKNEKSINNAIIKLQEILKIND